MRDRLLVSLVALMLAVVGVVMFVRGHATSEMVHAQEERNLERTAVTMAALLGGDRTSVTGEQLGGLLHRGEQVVYVDPRGRRVEASGPSAEPGHGHDGLTVTRPVEGGGQVTLTLDATVVDARVADALLPLVLLGLGLAVAAAVAAFALARRLSQPFRELAGVAERIGRGDFGVEVPRYRVPEADAVARVLRASAQDLDLLVRRERDFAAHASHELRTPITATRLELEDLVLSPRTPPEVVESVSGALVQLERLSNAVAGMLDASRERRMGASVDIDLSALVHDAASRWRRRVSRGRRIVSSCDAVVAVRLPAGSLIQVVDALIANAVAHGEGTITVSVSETPGYAEVRVSDEGAHGHAAQGLKDAAVDGHRGIGTATEIAESLGGQLRLVDEPRTTFSLAVPRARRETVAS
jgi:signal transduction histidine kinase